MDVSKFKDLIFIQLHTPKVLFFFFKSPFTSILQLVMATDKDAFSVRGLLHIPKN